MELHDFFNIIVILNIVYVRLTDSDSSIKNKKCTNDIKTDIKNIFMIRYPYISNFTLMQ